MTKKDVVRNVFTKLSIRRSERMWTGSQGRQGVGEEGGGGRRFHQKSASAEDFQTAQKHTQPALHSHRDEEDSATISLRLSSVLLALLPYINKADGSKSGPSSLACPPTRGMGARDKKTGEEGGNETNERSRPKASRHAPWGPRCPGDKRAASAP